MFTSALDADRWVRTTVLYLACCLTSGKLLDFADPQFIYNSGANRVCLIRLLPGLNETTYRQCLGLKEESLSSFLLLVIQIMSLPLLSPCTEKQLLFFFHVNGLLKSRFHFGSGESTT